MINEQQAAFYALEFMYNNVYSQFQNQIAQCVQSLEAAAAGSARWHLNVASQTLKTLTNLMKSNLADCDKIGFDLEKREFITEVMMELAVKLDALTGTPAPHNYQNIVDDLLEEVFSPFEEGGHTSTLTFGI